MNAHYERGGVKLICGDCLDIMPEIADKSIDMIFADLPYGVTQCKWDSQIDLSLLWPEYERLLTPNSPAIFTGTQPFTSSLVMSKPDWFRYEVILLKSRATGFLNCKRRPLVAHENVLIFSKESPRYNPQMIKSPGHKRGGGSTVRVYGGYDNFEEYSVDEYYPRSLFVAPSISRNDSHFIEETHPSQKPLSLLEWLIKTHTSKEHIIFDNVMGSGTTLVAAARLGRSGIGIEKEPEYFELACRRLDAEFDRIESELPLG